jgi:glutamine---fructose-6-phosphate transaminase (isomerizing)
MKSLGNFPDPFIAEISGQPDALRRAASALADQAGTLASIAATATGRTLVFTGMGSSYDACYPAVAELARGGIAAVMLDSAELLHFRTAMLGPHTLVVAVSQSGESAEVVKVAEHIRSSAVPSRIVAVTNGRTNTLSSLADDVLDTAAGEESGPSTMTFAGSLVVVGAIAAVLTGASGPGVVERFGREADMAAVAMERLLDDLATSDELVAWLGDRDTAVILGRGPARAAAEMGALTIKEAVGMPIEALQTAQFRHGPLELVGPNLAAMLIATEPETAVLDMGLAKELSDAGASVFLITEATRPAGIPGLAIGPVDRLLSSAVSIVPAQLLAWKLSALRGRQPGAYYRASKVTTRE